MKTKTEGAGITQGVSESDKLLPLPKLVHVRQDSGQLQEGTPDLQYERFGCELSSLDRQEAFVRIRGGKAMKFRTADVADPFVSAEAQMKAVAWFKKHLYQTHDYFFTPTVDDTDHEMSRSNETGHEITMIELPADAEFIVEEESPML